MSVYKDEQRGTWYCMFRYNDWTGRQKQKCKRGFKTKREAKEYEEQFMQTTEADMNMKVEAFVETYFRDKQGELKERSIKNKRYMIERHILPYFENKSMNEITPADIIQWQNKMREAEYSQTYLRMLQNQMTALFTHASNIYNLTNNPCKKVKKMGKSDADKMDFWTYEEYQQFINTIEVGSRYYVLFEILFWTGMRIGELLALFKSDVNFQENKISISKTYYRTGGKDVITTPKTEQSVRTIDIPEFLTQEIKAYCDKMYEFPDSERLFPIVGEAVQHKLVRHIQKAGVKKIRVHDRRSKGADETGMAYTRIHAVKATVQKALKYICNPEKTDGQILIDSFACGVETAHYDFMDALSKSSGVGDKQAFHLIQSFAPGEVDFDTAHQVGIELADKILENKYSYVIATHIDKKHCHNHIIFCAVDNVEHKKYNDCKRTYRNIRNLSDKLCKEHGLSVIIPSGQKGKTHYEWQMAKAGTSWKAQMKSDMDDSIREAHSYEDFISRMQTKGYKVKGKTFGDNVLKYLSFSASGQTRFTRVTEKNFGVGYTKEAIRDRIEKRVKAQEKFPVKKKIPFPKRPDAKRILIDTDKEKFQANGALKHWADIQNLKIAAASYAEGGSVEELERKIAEKNATAKTARSEIVDLEHEMKAKAEILKYAKQYVANRKYQRGYEKAKDQDAYFRSHETQIILFGGAENMLKRYGIKIALLDVEKMQAEYDAMATEKAKLKKTYQVAEKEAMEANKQLKNIRQYLGIERDKQETTKQHEKQDMSL